MYKAILITCCLCGSLAQKGSKESIRKVQPEDEQLNSVNAQDWYFNPKNPENLILRNANDSGSTQSDVSTQYDQKTITPTTYPSNLTDFEPTTKQDTLVNNSEISSQETDDSVDVIPTDNLQIRKPNRTQTELLTFQDDGYEHLIETTSDISRSTIREAQKPTTMHVIDQTSTERPLAVPTLTVDENSTVVQTVGDIYFTKSPVKTEQVTLTVEGKPVVQDFGDIYVTEQPVKTELIGEEKPIVFPESGESYITEEPVKTDQVTLTVEERPPVVQSVSETERPVKIEQVTLTVEEMNKKKNSGQIGTTEIVPVEDTPPYPSLPTLPFDEEGVLRPRPHVQPHKGHLDLRISIPHIFHLSFGHTKDGRRRFEIQAPFFTLDLVKPGIKANKK